MWQLVRRQEEQRAQISHDSRRIESLERYDLPVTLLSFFLSFLLSFSFLLWLFLFFFIILSVRQIDRVVCI
jgi:hypothetical protein